MTTAFRTIEEIEASDEITDTRLVRRLNVLAETYVDTEHGHTIDPGGNYQGEVIIVGSSVLRGFLEAQREDDEVITELLMSTGIACHTHTSRVIHLTTSYYQYSHRCFDCSGSQRRQFIERRTIGSGGVGSWKPHGVLVGYGCSGGPA